MGAGLLAWKRTFLKYHYKQFTQPIGTPKAKLHGRTWQSFSMSLPPMHCKAVGWTINLCAKESGLVLNSPDSRGTEYHHFCTRPPHPRSLSWASRMTFLPSCGAAWSFFIIPFWFTCRVPWVYLFFFFGCAESLLPKGFPVTVHGLLIAAFLGCRAWLGVVSLITFTGLVAPQLVRSSRSRDWTHLHWLAES